MSRGRHLKVTNPTARRRLLDAQVRSGGLLAEMVETLGGPHLPAAYKNDLPLTTLLSFSYLQLSLGEEHELDWKSLHRKIVIPQAMKKVDLLQAQNIPTDVISELVLHPSGYRYYYFPQFVKYATPALSKRTEAWLYYALSLRLGHLMHQMWDEMPDLPEETAQIMDNHLNTHQYSAMIERRHLDTENQRIYPFSAHLALFTSSWRHKWGITESLSAQEMIARRNRALERQGGDERFYLNESHLAVMPDRMWNYVHPKGSMESQWLGKAAGCDSSDNLAIIRECRKLREKSLLTWEAVVAHELSHCGQMMDNLVDEKILSAPAQITLREAITEMHCMHALGASGRSRPELLLRNTLKHKLAYYCEAFFVSQVLPERNQKKLIDLLSEKCISDWSPHDIKQSLGMSPAVWEKLSQQLVKWSELSDIDETHPLFELTNGRMTHLESEAYLKQRIRKLQLNLMAEERALQAKIVSY